MKTPNFPVFILEKCIGTTLANSPSPSSLPLPSFSNKKPVQESAKINRFGTWDLRLGWDLEQISATHTARGSVGAIADGVGAGAGDSSEMV